MPTLGYIFALVIGGECRKIYQKKKAYGRAHANGKLLHAKNYEQKTLLLNYVIEKKHNLQFF